MEAIFSARMALRQEHVRAAIGATELTDLLREAGLPSRDRVSIADVPTGQLLAELAPPAPTGRYALGTELRAEVARLRPKRIPWLGIGAVTAGCILGVVVTLVVMGNRSKPGPIVIHGTPPVVTQTEVMVAPTARKVVVPLPFLATHVELDDAVRDLDPPGDVAAFDVPAEAGMRHRVSVVAIDGTRADGFVREQDGIARPEGEGYAFVTPEPSATEIRVPPQRPARPLGTVHNGFTKLR
jgi:hypothetical protein